MGYYDSHTQTRSRKGKSSAKKTAAVSFTGAVIGALIVVFSIPLLAGNGFLPYDVVPKSAGDAEQEALEAITDGEAADIPELQGVNVAVTSEVIEAVERVNDAVVGVVNSRGASGGLFEGGGEGTGSGVVYKIEGDRAFIVTNQHVIENAEDIDVTLSDGARIPAELVGEDALTDLAVIEVDAEKVGTVAEFGNSDTLRAGEPAIAIGNPLSFEGSVTLGIISAVERSIPVDTNRDGRPDWNAEVLQTDAAINPGNSGGALVNIEGQVIGINSMKIAQNAVEGIGFAIPTAIAMPVIEDLEQYGEVRRPQLGVFIRSLQEIPSYHWHQTLGLPEDIAGGIYVADTEPGSPAAEAGLREGDVITALDGEEMRDIHDLRKYLFTEKSIGDTVSVTFYREGTEETVEMTLQEQQM
ncbi:S1C family serine protease [Alteribacter natronophilus]|uniref:S1C family serine protease n=1 Tax=Alteribacter natronophilus TaxID=2583810 RepID=UPI00110D7523|nr:trypsin-like peptidase domain-containing protein [Alteribacter natronophilus]TMW72034.1 PDZ domain-containing protein [Alteribacter natronophilus]